MIKMGDHTRQLQNETAEELDRQKELEDRIERNLDRTDANLRKSAKTIKAIKRPFWTAVKGLFVSKKKDKDLRQPGLSVSFEEERKEPFKDELEDFQVVESYTDREGNQKTYDHINT